MPQIRLTRTAQIDHVLSFLQEKYPLLSEAEIIKMVLSEKFRGLKEKSVEHEDRNKSVKVAYRHLMSEGKKLGDKLLAKKGLKRKDVTEQQFYDLILDTHKQTS